uniref:Uncharacterized protein n=1 Tax=Arundo donax TaxID=35708 RepID=A0A0A9G6X7_ARUDO
MKHYSQHNCCWLQDWRAFLQIVSTIFIISLNISRASPPLIEDIRVFSNLIVVRNRCFKY